MNSYIEKYRNKLATAAFLVIVIAGIKFASDIITPFIFALFLSIITMPIVNMLKRAKIPHGFAVIGNIFFIMSVFVVIGQFFYGSMKMFSANMRQYYEQFLVRINDIPQLTKLQDAGLTFDAVKENLSPQNFVSFGVDALGMFSSLSATLFLVLIITAFMMLEVDVIKKKVKDISGKSKDIPDKILDFTKSVRKYLIIKTAISLLTAVIIGIGLYFLGVPHFLLFAVIVFFLNYIPTIGSIVAGVPAVLIAFVACSPTVSVAVIALYVVTNIGLGSVMEPRLMGDNLGLSTLIVFSSLIVFGWLFGSAGMLLAVPLTMIVKIAADKSDRWHWVSLAMAAK